MHGTITKAISQMDNSLLTGKYIKEFISENEEVLKIIPADKVVPLYAEPDTTFPFVVYTREIVPEYTKDILTGNAVTFNVAVVSNDYVQSLELANAVRNAIEGHYYKDEYITIGVIHVSNAYEDTVSDAYIQRLTFTMNVR